MISNPLRHLVVAGLLAVGAACGCGSGDGDEAPAYTLDFAVTSSSGTIGALQLEVTHLGNSGGFVGNGDAVDCAPLVDALVAANFVGERTLKVGLISLEGIATPAPVLRCGFQTEESLDASDFEVQVVDASSRGGDPIEPTPIVEVSVTPR